MLIAIITFALVLSTLILIHEWGHFIAARKLEIWVEEFGLGLPPRIIGKLKGNTIYSLNWLPIGGFVRLHGENLEEKIEKPEVAFLNKSKRVRITVIIAGVVMNIVLGLAAFSLVYTVNGIPKERGFVDIALVAEGSPAQTVGLTKGDIIKEVNGNPVTKNSEFIKIIDENRGREVNLSIERNGQILQLKTTPRENPPEGQGALGVGLNSSIEIYYPPFWQRPFLGMYYGVGDAIFWGKAVLGGLGGLGRDISSGQVPKDIAGPVGIFQISSQVCTEIVPCIHFVGVLSINLAIINILPIPALDGGRLIFIIIEMLTRRRVTPKIESTIHAIGMAGLLLLLVGITFFDLKRLAGLGQLPNILQGIFK